MKLQGTFFSKQISYFLLYSLTKASLKVINSYYFNDFRKFQSFFPIPKIFGFEDVKMISFKCCGQN